MKIILISGKAESGKSTAAKYLYDCLTSSGVRACIAPYGQYVKDTARMLFGWDGKKDESGRKLLQTWGTDIVRKKDDFFWIDAVMRLAAICKSENLFDVFIVDDARFVNEIEAWKMPAFNGRYYFDWNDDVTTIRIERPDHENALTPEQRMHPSETELDNYEFDVVITATNETELKNSIDLFVYSRLFNR